MFDYFWVPKKYLPEGVGFSLYGVAHLAWLAALAAMCLLMIVSYRRMGKTGRRRLARWVSTGLLTLEITEDIYLIAMDAWEWGYLPLHLCSLTMFFMVIWSWKPNYFCGQVLYGLGIAGALSALLFCNWTKQPLWQFQSVYSFLFHGILVGWILMVLLGGDIRPDGKGFWSCVIFLCVAAPVTAVFNHILPDCNFFFTNGGSEGSPLQFFINLFGQPWWLIAYSGLTALVLAAEFLPWQLASRKKERRGKMAGGLTPELSEEAGQPVLRF